MSRTTGVIFAAAIALAITAIAATFEYLLGLRGAFQEAVMGSVTSIWVESVATTMIWTAPEIALALLVYEVARRQLVSAEPLAETHCRRCAYILRGLREPQCPECGERI